jgi:hypothetical protein
VQKRSDTARSLNTSKDSLVLQRSPDGHDLWIVNHQRGDRYPSNLCSGLQLSPFPDEVLRPAVASGMEKAHNFSRVRIEPSHIRPLEAIAMDTGKSEIFKFSFATMLLCNDVIYLEGRRMKS